MEIREKLVAQAWAKVDQVANDPWGRYQLRWEYYQQYGDAILDGFGMGNSELAFLHWELRRGVLNPVPQAPGYSQAGSPWWRGVNEIFDFYSTLGGLAYEALEREGWVAPVQNWINYIKDPSPKSWYKAHNCSIVNGYLHHLPEAKQESADEQYFINVVLFRVLYAQALVMDATIFGELGQFNANPRLNGVGILTTLPAFYPTNYPLTPKDIKNVKGENGRPEGWGVKVMDDLIVLPNIIPLYQSVAEWDQVPQVTRFLDNHKPCYPHIQLSQTLPNPRNWGENL
ncbi:MAG: hypothetical protein A2527_05840 [Candidatus Lambdaproteobacteria bacterium RIFOXYD2_FULL_50_16]|uniref:Uncharacterized protein n=1 Tax=Candidatus Lambdaproteobacteria bacterium RIFOXYD2_FULL_50_16 TaxID=1817772 RepID=A0A1F6G9H2_9PROT|nr:MAG: hypothetical protein A2527_05840 [Candidatus Lambdaproteobacteria bacterium RIFOXYD2_FULL_50_16]